MHAIEEMNTHCPLPDLASLSPEDQCAWIYRRAGYAPEPICPPPFAWCWILKSVDDIGKAAWDAAELINRIIDLGFHEDALEVSLMAGRGIRVLAHDPDLAAMVDGEESFLLVEATTADLARGLDTWVQGARQSEYRLVPLSLAVLDDLNQGNAELLALSMGEACPD